MLGWDDKSTETKQTNGTNGIFDNQTKKIVLKVMVWLIDCLNWSFRMGRHSNDSLFGR